MLIKQCKLKDYYQGYNHSIFSRSNVILSNVEGYYICDISSDLINIIDNKRYGNSLRFNKVDLKYPLLEYFL